VLTNKSTRTWKSWPKSLFPVIQHFLFGLHSQTMNHIINLFISTAYYQGSYAVWKSLNSLEFHKSHFQTLKCFEICQNNWNSLEICQTKNKWNCQHILVYWFLFFQACQLLKVAKKTRFRTSIILPWKIMEFCVLQSVWTLTHNLWAHWFNLGTFFLELEFGHMHFRYDVKRRIEGAVERPGSVVEILQF
jgi:hypothetical protein